MENEIKLVKLYSNNSKKSRLKRKKNKFQRIWDAEKQTYIKVRKSKYAISSKPAKKDWREKDNSRALKRRQKTPKTTKRVPVNTTKKVIEKPENKQPARKKVANTVRINGISHTWDSKNLRYKRAA